VAVGVIFIEECKVSGPESFCVRGLSNIPLGVCVDEFEVPLSSIGASGEKKSQLEMKRCDAGPNYL
jgi:hypothetical protein